MEITENIVIELGRRINKEGAKKDYTYVPPYDIKKSVAVFIDWLRENGYEITKTAD